MIFRKRYTRIWDAIRRLKVVSDGWKFIVGFALFGLAILWFDRWFPVIIGVSCLVFSAFCVYFFRDAEIKLPAGDTNDIFSPADGRIMDIGKVDGEGYGQGWVIRIFLSVFDIHVQYAPAAGTVKEVSYRPGAFLDARDPRAPFSNEQNAIIIECKKGRIMVKQIAGLLARRIVCMVKSKDELVLGDKIGLIRFGSQVDIYLPPNCTLKVKEGDRVSVSSTPIAQWS